MKTKRGATGGGSEDGLQEEGENLDLHMGLHLSRHSLLPYEVSARTGNSLKRYEVDVEGRGHASGSDPVRVGTDSKRLHQLETRKRRAHREGHERGQDRPERRDGTGGYRRDDVHHKARFPFFKLMTLVSETEPNKLLIELDSNGFSDLIRTPITEVLTEDFMALIIRALTKAVSSDSLQLRTYFLAKIYERKEFITFRLLNYIGSIENFAVKSRRNSGVHLQAVSDLVSFVQISQQTIPKYSSSSLSVILPILGDKITFLNARNYGLPYETAALFARIKAEHDRICGLDVKEKAEAAKVEREQSILPPEDFRTVTVCPNVEDIHGTEKTVFLRPNIAKGRYHDVNHYLDVQFRLLREDFARPLREGIHEYLSLRLEGRDMPHSLKSLRLYSGIHILKSEMKHNGIVHNATFDVTPFKHIRWQFNKRLLPGSLLCLTWDDFQTFCFASVAGKREAKNLSKGMFQLRFEDINTDIVARITPSVTLTMVESMSYFEALPL